MVPNLDFFQGDILSTKLGWVKLCRYQKFKGLFFSDKNWTFSVFYTGDYHSLFLGI